MTKKKEKQPMPTAEETALAAGLGIQAGMILRSAPSPILACSALSVTIAWLCVELDEDPVEFTEKLLTVAREVRDRTRKEEEDLQ